MKMTGKGDNPVRHGTGDHYRVDCLHEVKFRASILPFRFESRLGMLSLIIYCFAQYSILGDSVFNVQVGPEKLQKNLAQKDGGRKLKLRR